MAKKNTTHQYTSSTLWEQIKQHLAERVVAFAFGSFVTLIGAYFTVLADHQRLNAQETDLSTKASKADIEQLNYKIDAVKTNQESLKANQDILLQYFKLVPKE